MTGPASPAPVWDVINGFGAYWALQAGIELGIFDELARCEAATPAELTDALRLADARDTVLLGEVLVALGLLDTDGVRLRLTPASARFLVSSAPASMVALVRCAPGPHGAWPQLAATLRAGHPARCTEDELDRLYPELVCATAATQRAVARSVAQVLRERGSLPDHALVVDLGCGSGAWLSELLGAAGPAARAIAADRANVLTEARRTLAGQRVEYLPGDYLTVALPPEPADVVVLAHVLRAEPPDRARALVGRALGLLGAAGTIVVADYFRPDPVAGADPQRSEICVAARHDLLLSLTMRASTAGRGVSVADLHGWLTDADAVAFDVLEPVPHQRVHLASRRPPEGSP